MVVEVLKEGEQAIGVVGPKLYMLVQDAMVVHGCTHGYITPTLAGDPNNGPLANDVSSPAPLFYKVKTSLIDVDIFI